MKLLYSNFLFSVSFERVNSLKNFFLYFLLMGKNMVAAIWDQNATLSSS